MSDWPDDDADDAPAPAPAPTVTASKLRDSFTCVTDAKRERLEMMEERGFTEESQLRAMEEARAAESKGKRGLGYAGPSTWDQQREESKRSRADDAARSDVRAAERAGNGNAGTSTSGGGTAGAGLGSHVAQHYNSRSDQHRMLDSDSPVLRLKNLNNWIKSVLMKTETKRGDVVFDLGGGKGGDLGKWRHCNVSFVVLVDIASTSVDHAIHRYNDACAQRSGHALQFPALFGSGSFCLPGIIEAIDKVEPGIRFNVVSCQMAFHYCFERESYARQCLTTISSRLTPGGAWIGTMLDANVLVKKLRAGEGRKFGNSIFSVEFDDRGDATKTFDDSAPFGIRYVFNLAESIDDCPEYLVHIPTLRRLANEYGMELELAENFVDYFRANSKKHLQLIQRMKVFDDKGNISADEWEVASIYMVVVFRKRVDAPCGGSADWRPPPLQHRPVTPDMKLTIHEIL